MVRIAPLLDHPLVIRGPQHIRCASDSLLYNSLIAATTMADSKYYELYRRSSLGGSLTDTLDDLISERRIEPQLAMKILTNFDKAVADVLADKVKSRLTFKGHLDTYRFCDDVWTFIIKDINFKLENGNPNPIQADRVKIVSCNTKRPGEA